MAKFEKVSKFKDVDFAMPVRKTKFSAGYDMVAVEDTIIPPYYEHLNNLAAEGGPQGTCYTLAGMAALTKQIKAKPTLVSTGVKCQLESGTYLELSVRSSTPLKQWIILANSVGIIDADYYNNSDNEGEIFFQLINLSPFPIKIQKGEAIGQGIIKKYEITDNDIAQGERVGGFGSTSK